MTETEETVLDPRSLVKALLQAHDDWSGAAGTPLYGEAADALNNAEAAVVAALSRAPEAGREGAAERLAIVAEKPAHLIRWGEGDRLDLQSVLAALSPPSTGGEGERLFKAVTNVYPSTAEPWGEQSLEIRALFERTAQQFIASNPSPEMGEISREEIARIIDPDAWDRWTYTPPGRKAKSLGKADAILSKLKENGLSQEELGGLAQSLPSGDAQERSPVPPSQGGGANPSDGSGA